MWAKVLHNVLPKDKFICEYEWISMYYTTFTGQWPCWFQRSDIWQRYGKTCCIQRCKQIASLSCYCCVFRWVHTCNVIAGLNSITLWVIETIWNYELNFHPMPHGVTVSCKHYTLGFPVCYRSPSDVFAASSGFVQLYIYIYYTLKKKRHKRRWWQRQLYTSTEVHSGSSLLADLNFQLVSGLHKNFTRMSPRKYEFLINVIGEKLSKKDKAFRKANSAQERLALMLCVLASGDSYASFSSIHFIFRISIYR
jgi:hypothetical protein